MKAPLLQLLWVGALGAGCVQTLSPKQVTTDGVIHKVAEINNVAASLGRSHADDRQVDHALNKILQDIDGVEEIAKIAIICRAMAYPQDASDVRIDRVYDRAYWLCVERLAADPGKPADAALSEVEAMSGLQAGDRLAFEDLLRKRAKQAGN